VFPLKIEVRGSEKKKEQRKEAQETLPEDQREELKGQGGRERQVMKTCGSLLGGEAFEQGKEKTRVRSGGVIYSIGPKE